MEGYDFRGMSRRSVLKTGAGASLLTAFPLLSKSHAAATVEQSVEWARVNLPKSTPDIVGGAAKEGKLVLTLQQFGDDQAMATLIGKFRERYPFLDVSYTSQISGQIMKKFSAEIAANKGISDYVMLPSNLKETNNYVDSGALAKFVVSQDAAFPEAAKRSGIWYTWLRQHSVTAYRVGAVSAEEKALLRDYKGLGDPRFKGRLGINNITTSVVSAGSYVLLNGSNPGLWDGLAANKPRVKPSSPALLDGLLAGEYDIAVMSGFPTAAGAAKTGAPVEFVISAPSPVLYSPGAISALAPNPNAARLWQDWAMSREGQEVWSSLTGSISCRNDVTGAWSQQQAWFFEDTKTHVPIDWADFTEKQSTVTARFSKDLQGG